MNLLADSGSTKTDWSIVENDGRIIKQITTAGTNPFYQSKEGISEEIKAHLVPQLPTTTFDNLYFYGAGCMGDRIDSVKRAIGKHLQIINDFEVCTDMLAAARSLCGHKPGIACIMGTGSNSCSFDGTNIIRNVSPLGFILGDEGSGAVLGKLLIGDILKNQLPQELRDKFFKQYNITYMDIIGSVYSKPYPNRFLASFAPFLQENIEIKGIRDIVIGNFKSFFKRNVMQYEGYEQYPIHFIGSIAFYHKKELEVAAKELGITIGKIEKSPMKGLIEYHSIS